VFKVSARTAIAARSMRSACGVALAIVLATGQAAAQRRSVLDPGTTDSEASRAPLSTGRFVDRAIGLSPCEADVAIAFSSDRTSDGVWAGRFRVHRAGAGGTWQLVVLDGDGVERFRQPIPTVVAVPPPELHTGLIASRRVRIQLLGPGVPGSTCPRVRLESELQQFGVSQPRGQVGDSDDRWLTTNPLFTALPDAASIGRWAGGVAHVLGLTPGGRLLPCSGFFIGPRVLVTAAHCIRSSLETPGSIVFRAGRALTGSQLKHVMSDLALDFTVIWITAEESPVTLAVGDATPASLILWQFPGEPGPVVSVDQCAVFAASADRLSHKCDSSVGTSGAPIQSRPGGEVVALHVEGCVQTSGTSSCVNHGIPFARIRARVRELQVPLRAAFPAEAPQILAAFGVSP
jgi:hypothetical protein